MADNDDFLLLSGIQHFRFCKRQWALIHIEQQWEENVRTVEGQHLHRKADQPFLREKRGDRIIVRSMPVKSERLQIRGVCDVVEFVHDQSGVKVSGLPGKYLVHPVEYKRGRPKSSDEDILQLVAQSMCLEEMLLNEIRVGYIYYHEIRHRIEVQLTEESRRTVEQIITEMHSYYHRKHTPKVKTGAFCRSCSLQHICLPAIMNKRSVKSYIEGKLSE